MGGSGVAPPRSRALALRAKARTRAEANAPRPPVRSSTAGTVARRSIRMPRCSNPDPDRADVRRQRPRGSGCRSHARRTHEDDQMSYVTSGGRRPLLRIRAGRGTAEDRAAAPLLGTRQRPQGRYRPRGGWRFHGPVGRAARSASERKLPVGAVERPPSRPGHDSPRSIASRRNWTMPVPNCLPSSATDAPANCRGASRTRRTGSRPRSRP